MNEDSNRYESHQILGTFLLLNTSIGITIRIRIDLLKLFFFFSLSPLTLMTFGSDFNPFLLLKTYLS
jgi:hypothetical protein